MSGRPVLRIAACLVFIRFAPGCNRDEADAGEYGGSDDGGTTACVDEPGAFDDVLDWSQASNEGIDAEFVAIHVAHLPPTQPDRAPESARFFVMGGDRDQHLWDPLTGEFTSIILNPMMPVNFFCAGHAITPSGSLLVSGGGGSDPGLAINVVYRYNPTFGIAGWQSRDAMDYDRWYPTIIMLADGKALAFGGGGLAIAEIYDPVNDAWSSVPEEASIGSPNYPYMFVLPDGNVFYAGAAPYIAEGGGDGRVLVLDDGPPYWSERRYPYEIGGGSAVQYSPGRFMKSGGGNSPTSRTQWIDMTGDYLASDRDWVELDDYAGDMIEPRQFHQLTILPDGRVVATGGNWYGNGESSDSPSNPCDDPPGSGNMINAMPCAGNGDCPTLLCTNLVDHDSDPATGPLKVCDPRNNACFSTKSAEIWDPETKLWSPCNEASVAEEAHERLYHSSALLQRDGGVISMGGGTRQGLTSQRNAQVFYPDYGYGTSPTLTLTTTSVTYGQSFNVSVTGAAPQKFNLVRLGSTTHSFNMDQRLVPVLEFEGDGDSSYTLEAPGQPGAAPPGWYMLFAVSATGAISEGQYLEINGLPPVEWICAQASGLTVKEKGCLPSAGPFCTGSTSDVTLLPPSLGGTQRGWAVQTPATAIENPASLTVAELAYVRSLCEQACVREWQNEPGVVATCTAPTAFATPTTRTPTGASTQRALIDAYAHGEGVFPAPSLACELDDTCCTAFDESVCAAASDRPTLAATPLERGEAYRVGWSTSSSNLKLITNQGTWTRTLSGSAGFSPCRDGNATAPCPFYLGSLTASTSSAISPTALCSDGSSATLSVSSVSIALSQPSTGIARQGTTERGFPAGGMVLSVTATVGGQPYTRRLPTSHEVVGTQNAAALTIPNVDTPLVLPCGAGTTTVTARVTLASTTATGSPPTATVTVPSQVTCGVARALTATTSDPDSDIVSTRWLVDGVLLASSVSSVTFTGPHELSVRVRDSRGATSTAKKVVSCL